jgi:hypothetical protein
VSKIESREVPEVQDELDGDGLVEPELLTELGDVPCVGRACLPGEHVGGVARRQVYEDEIQNRDADDDHDRLAKPPQDELHQPGFQCFASRSTYTSANVS